MPTIWTITTKSIFQLINYIAFFQSLWKTINKQHSTKQHSHFRELEGEMQLIGRYHEISESKEKHTAKGPFRLPYKTIRCISYMISWQKQKVSHAVISVLECNSIWSIEQIAKIILSFLILFPNFVWKILVSHINENIRQTV